MRAIAIVLLLLAAVCTMAAANPVGEDWLYITYDPAGDPNQNEVSPAPYTTVDSYVFGDFSLYGDVGFTTISFMLNDPVQECPGVMATSSFVNLLPGGLSIGIVTEGITIASTECMTGPTAIGYLSCFYLGGACSICILDHPEYPRWVVDCQDPGQVFYYKILNHGYVGGSTVECPPVTPVENASWGAIKAMYRE